MKLHTFKTVGREFTCGNIVKKILYSDLFKVVLFEVQTSNFHHSYPLCSYIFDPLALRPGSKQMKKRQLLEFVEFFGRDRLVN